VPAVWFVGIVQLNDPVPSVPEATPALIVVGQVAPPSAESSILIVVIAVDVHPIDTLLPAQYVEPPFGPVSVTPATRISRAVM